MAANDEDRRLAKGTSTDPIHVTADAGVAFTPREPLNEQAIELWTAVRFHTDQIGFNAFHEFMGRAVNGSANRKQQAPGAAAAEAIAAKLLAAPRDSIDPLCGHFGTFLPGVDAYSALKLIAEIFLLTRCGVCPTESGVASDSTDSDSIFGGPDSHLNDPDKLAAALSSFLGKDRHSYIRQIVDNVFEHAQPGNPLATSPVSVGLGPCLLELIWSYWHEEGMLAQTMNAITLRFQNVRRGTRDPLAELEIDPLRPLGAFLWGYIQDETHRLSVARRAYEYNHHYGLNLAGKAVANLRPADPRSQFLRSFHDLLRHADMYYREAADNTVTPDAFPLLIALRDLHMILSEGAHNQFRDLPWTARVDMLIQQWLLARPEMRDFLRGRLMVPYKEGWMGAVDAMKRLQGWSDTNVTHFRDLGVFGERILLSVRYVAWNSITDPQDAADWALFWRQEIQGYVHAYRAATGITLTDDIVEVSRTGDVRYLQPAFHLRNRLSEQRTGALGRGGNGAAGLPLSALPRSTPRSR